MCFSVLVYYHYDTAESVENAHPTLAWQIDLTWLKCYVLIQAS